MALPAPYSAPAIPGAVLLRRGKVRDVYAHGDDQLLVVATDRISAFDVVLEPGIAGKGIILTQMSNFWFDTLREVVPNHLVATRFEDLPAPFSTQPGLARRSCLVKALRMLPVECVVRGYLVGSGWKEYQAGGTVCGLRLPAGLRQADRLPEPIFTPATKAEEGHDENISFEAMAKLLGDELAARARDVSLELYSRAAAHAEKRGIVIADTKFEFGLDASGALVLADEALTPDSSRFWPRSEYRPGSNPPSYDKQFVRDWLEASDWNKEPPAPTLPADVIEGTVARYLEAYERLTGSRLEL